MSEVRLYFIPGMGADARLFEGLKRQGLEFEVLEFIPAIRGESMAEYAMRLAEGIDQQQPYILAGVSLGGMMASEIAENLKPEKLILISTVKRSAELPFYFKTFRYLPLHKAFSGKFLARYGPRERRNSMEPWQADILENMRKEADSDFIEWAINAVVNWKKRKLPPNFVHFHGTQDLLLPGLFVKHREKYAGGKHVMVLTTHAKEIADEIRNEIKKVEERLLLGVQ